MHGDWVAATASVIAAIIGVVGGYFLARYQRERRHLRIVTMETEDLSATLRQHGDFEFTFNRYTTSELILSTLSVRNMGNRSLSDVLFSVKLPGRHPFAKASCFSDDKALASEVAIVRVAPDEDSPEFFVKLPYFNVRERFHLKILYNGGVSNLEIACRLPDTEVEISTAAEQYQKMDRRNRWKTAITILLAALSSLAFAWISVELGSQKLQSRYEEKATTAK
ncbi:hypothetical protein [Bradyrhizobium sp. SBR1B]|uniref:hypothetical protein n=1 Tax=Bradyrhizobium sp. SBR1B TaxID=2663836 RepID=UPI001606D0A8|nr:hypothetical protein [Bradyrhizobium sp. SBR1B]MBB4379382.1 hypothetical protein [Bradyrhizobium sp. SBR1B]